MSTRTFEKSSDGITTVEMRKLLLYNSAHYWDDVIQQLARATGFDSIHCEQIAMIAHTKGKAVVKSGDMDELRMIEDVLNEIGLVTSIE